MDDVSITGGFIRCESGGKTRIIPLYPEAVQALHTYMDDVRLKMLATPSERSLFVNVSGERISRPGLLENYQSTTRKRRRSTRTSRRIPCGTALPRICWRTARTSQDCHSGDALVTATFPLTQVYAHLVKQNLKSVYNKYHPKA